MNSHLCAYVHSSLGDFKFSRLNCAYLGVFLYQQVTREGLTSPLGTRWAPVAAVSDPVCEGWTNLTCDTLSLDKLAPARQDVSPPDVGWELILTMRGHLNAGQERGCLSLKINDGIRAQAFCSTQPTSAAPWEERQGRCLTCSFADVGDVLLLLFLAFFWIPMFLCWKDKEFIHFLHFTSFPESVFCHTGVLTLLLSFSVWQTFLQGLSLLVKAFP